MAPSISSDQLGHCAWFGICESLREGKEMEGERKERSKGWHGRGGKEKGKE